MKYLTLSFLILFSFSVYAGVCFEVNSENDTLMPNEQNAAKYICEQEFIKEGAIVDGKCDVTYVITHLILGNSIVVIIEKGAEKHSIVIEKKEELAGAYNQLARAFLKGIPVDRKHTTTENVVGTQAKTSQKIKSELNFMILLGYGFQPTKDIGVGINWTLGLRYDMRFMFLDFEFASGLYNAHGPTYFEFNMVGFKGAYYFSETSPTSFYAGAGIRAGFYFLEINNSDYWGEDLEFSGSGTVSIGHEWLRNTSKRFMIQLDAKFPFHTMKIESDRYDGYKKLYFPTISFNFGVGL
jgi:hypothetical protein